MAGVVEAVSHPPVRHLSPKKGLSGAAGALLAVQWGGCLRDGVLWLQGRI
jgi:hypothetical protein